MKRFKFRLKNLEKLKIRKEEAEVRRLGKAQAQLESEKLKKMAQFSTIDQAYERREVLSDQQIDIEQWKLENQYISGTKYLMVQTDQAIGRAERVLKKTTESFLNARKEKMIIGNLKERSFLKHKNEERKKEQKEIDDIVLMRERIKKVRVVVALLMTSFLSSAESYGRGPQACVTGPEILEDLKIKELELQERESEVALKLAEIQAKEKVLTDRLEELEKRRAELSGLESRESRENDVRIGKLVDTVEAMSPKASAKLLSEVDPKIAVEAMQRIETDKLARIMNGMDAKIASRLTELMATGGRSIAQSH
jgi:flagellar export protein FliJ